MDTDSIKRIPVAENFFLDEFIDNVTYSLEGDTSKNYIDNRVFSIAQHIRNEANAPMTINNWFNKGQYKESGLRRPDSKTGAKRSAHKFQETSEGILIQKGCAIDIKINGMNGEQMFDFISEHKNKLYELGVRRVEHHSLTPTWCHLDCKEHSMGKKIIIIDLTSIVASLIID